MAEISEALKQRDTEEVMRSQDEARKTILKRCEVDGYLAPAFLMLRSMLCSRMCSSINWICPQRYKKYAAS